MKDFEIKNNDRIAQMILSPVIKMKLEETENLSTISNSSGSPVIDII